MGANDGGMVLSNAAALPVDSLPETPYFGPSGFMGLSSAPKVDTYLPKTSMDVEERKKLWEMCYGLCQVTSEILSCRSLDLYVKLSIMPACTNAALKNWLSCFQLSSVRE